LGDERSVCAWELLRAGITTSPTSRAKPPLAELNYQMDLFPPEHIRNFSIIAHVDHGKSTLADRLLEMTGTIVKGANNAQYLDKLQVERDRGITVKAQTATLLHRHQGGNYLLNLIDTPGHVDFSYEVSRSLAACQGALLLVDASQGIQAQTVANFYLAWNLDLKVVPVINKIDIPSADPEKVTQQVVQMFDVDESDVLYVSAKTGVGMQSVLEAVVEKIPAPTALVSNKLQVFLFDCFYDEYRGVICLVELMHGKLTKGDKVISKATGKVYEVLEIGVLHPEPVPSEALYAGQVGYIITGMKSTREARIGDTFCLPKDTEVEALPGFQPAKPMVYAGVYAVDSSQYENLRNALDKLTLNDASVSVTPETSAALGAGFRCGFLGVLHLDVVMTRLQQEYKLEVLATSPTVPYEVTHSGGTVQTISNPVEMPDTHLISSIREPTVTATIITPAEYVGSLLQLCMELRGTQKEYTFLDGDRVLLRYQVPLPEIVTGFYDELKSRSSGYATFDYEDSSLEEADVVQLSIRVNGEMVDAMTNTVHRSKALRVGRSQLLKLKEILPRQQFQVALQAMVDNKVIARETISAVRKDVTAKCYGGDVSRKRKLLEKQKEGKKRMKRIGSVDIPQDAFVGLLKQ